MPPKRTVILNDVSAIIKHMSDNRKLYVGTDVPDGNEQKSTERKNRYDIFLKDDEKDHYYSDVTICKFLFYDLVNGSNMDMLRRYVPDIEKMESNAVEKVYYEDKTEEFVIITKEHEYRIYRSDIRYIYPFYCQVKDPVEYEIVYFGDKVYTYSKFNENSLIPVFSSK